MGYDVIVDGIIMLSLCFGLIEAYCFCFVPVDHIGMDILSRRLNYPAFVLMRVTHMGGLVKCMDI